jgi:poly [ADP-ribose] polymerase
VHLSCLLGTIWVQELTKAVSHRVYIDSDGVIYDAALNQTNVGGNNNKFYRIQILESYSDGTFTCWTRWGRVGERGQNKAIPCGNSFDLALREYSKKFKDKSGLTWDDRNKPGKANKYVFVERSYEPDTSSEDEDALLDDASDSGLEQSIASSEEVKSELELPVQDLMSLIFNQQFFVRFIPSSSRTWLTFDRKRSWPIWLTISISCPLGS